MVTAGPTVERIDPVRFFTNRSTGKMGYALAEQAAKLGAGTGIVVGIGMKTAMGQIADLLQNAEVMITPLQRKFEQLLLPITRKIIKTTTYKRTVRATMINNSTAKTSFMYSLVVCTIYFKIALLLRVYF